MHAIKSISAHVENSAKVYRCWECMVDAWSFVLFFLMGFYPTPQKKPQFYHSLGGTNGNHTIHTKILTHETYNEGSYNTTFRTFLTDKIMLFINASFTFIFTITQGKLYIQELPSLGVKITIFFTLIAK